MNWLLLSFAVLAAGFIQGLTGFGFGLVSISLLAGVIGTKAAAAISTTFSLVATSVTFFRHYREYNWRQGLPFLIALCFGVPCGALFLNQFDEATLKRILGVLLIAIALRELLSKGEAKSVPRGLVLPLGFFSGALSGAFNLGGIPTAVYAYSKPWSRGQIMAFLQVMLALSCAIRIGFYGTFGYFNELSPFWIVAMIVPLYLTIWLGHYVLERAHPRHTRQFVFIFIGLAGLYYLSGIDARYRKSNFRPVHYTIRSTRDAARLDLNGDNPAWLIAETLEVKNFRPESSNFHPHVSARLLHDDHAVYGIFRVQDQYVRCVRQGYGSEVWKDSCVEFFAEPKPGKGYFNFEFNCGGSFLCNHIVDPARGPGGFKDFTRLPESVAQQIQVYSSLPARIEPEIAEPTTWTLQFTIPFTLFTNYIGAVDASTNQVWRGNFFKCVEDNSHPHWAAWSPVPEFNFHLPQCFGEIRFE